MNNLAPINTPLHQNNHLLSMLCRDSFFSFFPLPHSTSLAVLSVLARSTGLKNIRLGNFRLSQVAFGVLPSNCMLSLAKRVSQQVFFAAAADLQFHWRQPARAIPMVAFRCFP
jgi:hypothetical protein